MESIEQIIEKALSLPNASRVLIVEKLVESLEFDLDETISDLWNNEAKKRRDEARKNIVQAIPGSEALAQVRRIIEP